MTGHARFLAPILACLLAAAAFAPAQGVAPFMRTVESDDGNRVTLEMAIRRLDHPRLPTIYLVAAVHIADRPFYDHLQRFLDQRALVLFEGVKPPGAGSALHDQRTDDAHRARITDRRIHFLAAAVGLYHTRTGSLPASFHDLNASLPRRYAQLIDPHPADAWGNPLRYHADADHFSITSLGADNRPGGTGPDADITFDSTAQRVPNLPDADDGIQSTLAHALGLVFQLDAMNHDGPNWVNADLSIDQVLDRLDASGDSAEGLFDALAGESFGSRVAAVLARALRLFPSAQTFVKLMLIEVIANADNVLDAVPPRFADLMDVLLNDRNRVVLDELRLALQRDPPPEDIAIIYGAGHLPDIQQHIIDDLGYHHASDRWVPAISVDLATLRMTPQQRDRMRDLIRSSIQRQLRPRP